MKRCPLAAVAAFGVMTTWPALAADDKWGAHIDFEGKAGTERRLGEADLFLPVAQDDNDLLFASIRTRMDDQSSREGNFGLGLRHMLESGWNVGGYGYFDRRRSEYQNYFNQVTVGAEALSLDWDVRVNGYVPVGRRSYAEDRFNTAGLSGASVIFRGGEERSLGGFDAEIGWRVPLFAADAGQQVRVYGGGYRFADQGVPTVAGPRGRAEMVFDEVPGLWDGSRLALGAELQHDDPRGTQGFLSARLRIPLQAEAAPSRLTPMERRMADPIVRDIDVVAQAGAFGATETATQLADGSVLRVVSSSSTPTPAALNTALTNAATAGGAAGSTVILSGTFGTGNNTAIVLQPNQTVMGRGSLTVRSPSGRTATLTASSGATISGYIDGADTGIVHMADNSTLTGMTISQSGALGQFSYGVLVNGATDVVISGNTITGTHFQNGVYGIFIDGGSGTITGNTITVHNSNPGGGSARGIRIDGPASVMVANNTISSTASYQSSVYITGVGTTSEFLVGSTGNIFRAAGECEINSGTVAGTLYYTKSDGVASSGCSP